MSNIESSTERKEGMEDDASRTFIKSHHHASAANHRGGVDEDEDDRKECDVEAWQTFGRSFKEVQSVLDQNRALIQQVNENHRSKSSDNMVKNVSLIREINGNISKVTRIYSDLSVDFSNIVQQQRAIMKNDSANSNRKPKSSGDS